MVDLRVAGEPHHDENAAKAGGRRWTLQIILPALVVAIVAGLRLWFDLAVPPMGDEAYYWIWGQRLAWSYFDHPPLDAWLQGLVAAAFGWSNFSLRLLTWLTFAGTLAVFWAWARRIMPQNPWLFFWRTSAVFLTVPVIALFTIQAVHDHLLVFFCVASLFFFWCFATDWEERQAGVRSLYLAALLLGLAALSKYNGALLGLGFAACFAVRPRLWSALRTPHPYLAALLAVALQAPVIYWNLTEGFASLHFHLVERPSGHWGRPDLRQVLNFLWQGIIAAGPVLVLGALRLPWLMRQQSEKIQRALALSVFFASTIAVACVAAFTDVLLHWNMVAYVGLALAGFWVLSRWWLFWPHVLITLYLLTVSVWNYAVAPISLPGFVDSGTAANYGWDQVALAVQAAERDHPQAFLAATKYNYAAQLAVQLHTVDVTAINPLRSQYDLWWDAAANAGKDAIIVGDKRNPIELSSPAFRTVTKLADVPVMRGGEQIWTFEIYLGEGYAKP